MVEPIIKAIPEAPLTESWGVGVAARCNTVLSEFSI